MGKKRIPVDKKQFEALKNELERVSGIDLSSDNAYYDLCDYIKKQNDIKFPPSKYEDGSIVQQPETISVDTLRRYWGDKDADKQMTPDVGKLSFIARALGYKDWGTFCHEHIQPDNGFDADKGFNGMDYFKFSSLCENEIGLTTNYSEGNFVPLAISSDNARNFFWEQNVKMPICDICKLILFCIPAGITTITKTVKENGEYKEKQLLSFVNLDTSVKKLYKTNMNFGNKSRYENKEGNPYTELILDIVEQDKQISTWQLENIFVVEFEAEYGAYSRIEYFNIKRYVSRFFTQYSEQTLLKIRDYRYRLQIVDNVLKNKDIKYAINDRLRDELNKENTNGYNSFLATRVRMILNLLKKEDIEMEGIKKSDAKLKVLYNLGIQMHEDLKRTGEENKIDGYTYKMLNSIKAGNKKQFMDIVIRIHMSMGKDVSPIFIETMQTEGLDFESIAHSFLAGLISNKYEKKDEDSEAEV